MASLTTTAPIPGTSTRQAYQRRTLVVVGFAHALHDGYTDLIYVLLPVWQAEFALGYGVLAIVRGLYTGAMAGLQIPVGRLAERVGGRAILAIGTALAACGYALAGLSGGLFGLCVALALSGAGSSTQHPIASSAVARAYGAAARGPLGIYNFTGDLGTAALPAATSVLLTLMPWRNALYLLAMLGIVVALIVAILVPGFDRSVPRNIGKTHHAGRGRGGFPLLFTIGVLDSAVRMGFLTFLPFLLKAKGASLPDIGFALSLVFIGGAAGKFACGWLGARFGVLWTVVATEGGTAVLVRVAGGAAAPRRRRRASRQHHRGNRGRGTHWTRCSGRRAGTWTGRTTDECRDGEGCLMARQIVNLDKLGEAQKTPIEADFEVTKADDTQIEVTFRPTESRYTFGRQEPSGEVSPVAKVRHGPPGDTDGYPKRQVHHLAYRLAEQEARKRWGVR